MQSVLVPCGGASACAQPWRRRVTVRASAVARRETDPRKRVVITGMGVVSVFGNDVDAYYDRLLAGESSVGPIDRFDASGFPTRFAAQIRGFSSEGYIDDKLDHRLDDCHRYALVAAKKALESAGLAPGSNAMEKINRKRAGVVIGSGMDGVQVFSNGVEILLAKGYRRISPFCIPGGVINMAPALVAMDAGILFEGPNYSISTACATSNHCFHNAADQIRLDRADIMVAGGTEASIGLGRFVACRTLSQQNNDPGMASRPWNTDRDGFVMGEGAGLLVMESLEHAVRRGAPILAEYLGGAVKSDAYHMTKPRLDGHGVSSCIKLALDDKPDAVVEQFDTVRNVKQQHEVQVGISNSFGFGGHNSVVVLAPYV